MGTLSFHGRPNFHGCPKFSRAPKFSWVPLVFTGAQIFMGASSFHGCPDKTDLRLSLKELTFKNTSMNKFSHESSPLFQLTLSLECFDPAHFVFTLFSVRGVSSNLLSLNCSKQREVSGSKSSLLSAQLQLFISLLNISKQHMQCMFCDYYLKPLHKICEIWLSESWSDTLSKQ